MRDILAAIFGLMPVRVVRASTAHTPLIGHWVRDGWSLRKHTRPVRNVINGNVVNVRR